MTMFLILGLILSGVGMVVVQQSRWDVPQNAPQSPVKGDQGA